MRNLLLITLCGGLLGCTQDKTPAIIVTGTAELTVEGGPTGPEDVSLATLTWSEVLEDGGGTLIATDDAGVHELMVRFADPAEGDQAPAMVRYRKGLQVLLDHEADCSASLEDTADVDQKWGGQVSCTGLRAEDPEGTSEGWTLEAEFSGGTTRSVTVRDEAFQGDGWSFGFSLLGPEYSAPIDHLDPDLALVLPYRGDEVWVLLDDGSADATTDDVVLKANPEPGELLLDKWVRATADELVAVSADISSTEELELTVGIEETGATETGVSVSIQLWDSLQGEPDELTLQVQ